MRHLLSCLLLACAVPASAQPHPVSGLPFQDQDLKVMQGGTAWLLGDHVKARHHFLAAAERGSPLGQYNLAMMLLYREGGPCDSVQAVALLRKSADSGVALARASLDQVQKLTTATSEGRNRPFPCRLPSHRIPAGRFRPSNMGTLSSRPVDSRP